LKKQKRCKKKGGILSTERKNFSPRILYPIELSFKIEGGIKIFHDKQKQYMTTKPPLQMILQGILHTEDENKQSLKDGKY
jgi:hypothetical protein